jgi:phosphoserine aminotransferase
MIRQPNFSGGPGALPDSVIQQTSDAILGVPEMGTGVLGISHRSEWFENVVDEAESRIRSLLGLTDDFHVLFLQGGGTLQFSMVPMTMLRGQDKHAEYVRAGYWSNKSIAEAEKEGCVETVWDGESDGFSRLPSADEMTNGDAAYFHYVSNETVEGLQFHNVPGRDDVPRVCDMSSDFLSRPIDPDRFDLIYAHAQKNLGPAGVTIVCVRDRILRNTPEGLPAMLDYRNHVKMGSIYNTAPVFAIYVTMLVSRWLCDDIGGLPNMDEINRRKAAMLYDVVDTSGGFYRGKARKQDRSLMNVSFNLPTEELERQFLDEAESRGLLGLPGHRSVGGVRASIYNAVTEEDVSQLCDFMEGFERKVAPRPSRVGQMVKSLGLGRIGEMASVRGSSRVREAVG